MVMPLRNINFQRLFKKLTPVVFISDNNTTPSFLGKQSVTAKERLSSTLKKLHADKDFKRIYWEQCLEKYPNLKELFLNGIGNVSIPISQKVIFSVYNLTMWNSFYNVNFSYFKGFRKYCKSYRNSCAKCKF